MVEYLESELMDSAALDHVQIMDEASKYEHKAKTMLPLRPLHLQDGQSYFSQWPMTNLRAKEAEKAA